MSDEEEGEPEMTRREELYKDTVIHTIVGQKGDVESTKECVEGMGKTRKGCNGEESDREQLVRFEKGEGRECMLGSVGF